MSEEIRLNLSRIGLIVSIMAASGALLAGAFILPYRLTAAEVRISALEKQAAVNQDLLSRIDENVKQIKTELAAKR